MKKKILLFSPPYHWFLWILGVLASVGVSEAQTTVSGTVLDETKSGLPGVNVVIKGTSQGTVTDIEGTYSLSAASTDTLTFTSVGYAAQTIPVNNRSIIDVTMGEDIQSLQEIVVVGYTAERKVDLTGAVAVVDLEPIDWAKP